MEKKLITIIACSLFFTCGCVSKIHVAPELQTIDPPEKIKNEYVGAKATIINKEKFGEIKHMTGSYSVPVEGNMYEWTEQAIALITKEIRQRGGDVAESSGKDIYVSFEGDELIYNQWNYSSTCKGTLNVETGSGYKKQYPVANTTGGKVERACGGAITLGVIEFLNDKNIMVFMKSN